MNKKPKIHMIGNTHFDPVWLWTWDEGMASIRSTFLAALDRMDEDPGFIYSFSCPPVFEWVREVDPGMFKRIQDKVTEGRWHLVEGWWLQPDCSAAIGESYVRQGLYGQRYLQEHFGCQSKTAFNTDSFGHSAMLPQILAKSGMEYYVLGRPSEAEKELPGPLFHWESPDGSTVLAYRWGNEGAGMYSQNVEKDIEETAVHLSRLGHDMMIIYGVTNHGGAPTKKAIGQIRKKMEDTNKDYDVLFSTTDIFFREQNTANLPTVQDELMVNFFGTFSNHPEVKKNNRLSEYALLNAEKTALIRQRLQGREYPSDKLTSAWKDILYNQFHDILGGACIKNAYVDARNLHGRVLQTTQEIIHYGLQSMTKEIDLSHTHYPGVAWNIVVWNLNVFDVEELVEAEVQWAWEFDWYRGPLRITDAFGVDIPCQVIREYSVIPGFRARVVFHAKILSLGYKTFLVHQEISQYVSPNTLCVSESVMENERFRLEICEKTGCIASIINKKTGHTVMRDAAKIVVREDLGDTWAFNVTGYGEERESIQMESASIIESGPVRAVIRTKSRYKNSHIEQDFILYRDLDIIDGSIKVFWKEKHKVLKLTFNTLLNEPSVTASIPYGSVVRGVDGREYPMGEWLDLSSNSDGVSILTDSVFAYDVAYVPKKDNMENAGSLQLEIDRFDSVETVQSATKNMENPINLSSKNETRIDNHSDANNMTTFKRKMTGTNAKDAVIGLTVLRSAIFGDLRIEPIDLNLDYDMLGQGISEGKWRMILHDESWQKAKIPQMAIQFNNPPIVIAEANHTGTQPPEESFLSIKSNSTILTTAKPSEEGDNLILRMFEYAGSDDSVQVTSKRLTLEINVHSRKYEIKTLSIDKKGKMKETNMLEE